MRASQFRVALVGVTREKEGTVALFHSWHDAMLAAQCFARLQFDHQAKDPRRGQFWKRRRDGMQVLINATYRHMNEPWVTYSSVKTAKVSEATREKFLRDFKLEKVVHD